MADCSYHPGRDAVGACVNCGKMVCLECRTLLGGKIYCQPCAEEIFVKKAPEAAKPEPKVEAKPAATGGVSGAWWLLPIFMFWLGGIIAWACTKDTDPKKAKSMLWWGIGLTFLYGALYVIAVLIFALAVGGTVGVQMPW